MNATNTFQDGLLLDSHPLAVPNNVLTNCLNGTLITYNGNELILLNDTGNSKIIYRDKDNKEHEVKLSDGFVPVGMKAFNGIIYIFSHNEKNGKGEIGTFPSPNYESFYIDNDLKIQYEIHDVEYNYKPLHNLIRYTGTYPEEFDVSKYQVVDFRTEKLNFDLLHPLTIDCLLSYDETVNLIFNDGKNIPRLVNSGFAPYGDHKVKIVKRDLLLETNVYEEENFEYNTSLIRVCNSIVNIKFDGESEDGNLPIGNYTFYFKVADSDGNESDFIGQSGLVVCHKGRLNDPKSIDGGIVSENSRKSVSFTITNIPRLFSRVYVYYSRYTSTAEGVLMTEYKKIDRYFDLGHVITDNDLYTGELKTRTASIKITGNDATSNITLSDINPLNLNILSAKTQAVTNNRLFMADIKDNITLYQSLKQYSILNIEVLPWKSENLDETLRDVYVDYTTEVTENCGYYNVLSIYNKVGYWPEEYYRFGVVFILDDYSLTPVFNIKGTFLYYDKNTYTYKTNNNEYGVILFPKEYFKPCIFDGNSYDVNTTHMLHFPKFTIKTKPPEHVIGCMFVRQKRLKNIIGQALLIGSDLNRSYTFEGKGDTIEGSHIPILWGGERYKWVALSFVRGVYTRLIPDDFLGLPTDPNTGLIVEPPYYNYTSSVSRVNNICFPHYNTYNDQEYLPYLPTLIFLGNSWITHQKSSWLNVFHNTELLTINYMFYQDAAIMPEFELNLKYYSGLFNGQKFVYDRIISYGNPNLSNPYNRLGINDKYGLEHLLIVDPVQNNLLYKSEAYIISVLEQTTVKTQNNIYTSVVGSATEPSIYATPFTDRLMYVEDKKLQKKSSFIKLGISEDDYKKQYGLIDFTYHTRGIFSPYLGIEDLNHKIDFLLYLLINIKLDTNLTVAQQVENRKQDYSEFYPISERIDFLKTYKYDQGIKEFKCFRGDCYIGNFTHRMLRNFIDPEFQLLEDYASKYCWALGNVIGSYDEDSDQAEEITDNTRLTSTNKEVVSYNKTLTSHLNRADVNAVPLGQWITFKYYSSINPCMRSTDSSNTLEYTTFGQPRKFYPLYNINLKSSTGNKLSDSYVYNLGYEQSVGQRMFNLYPEIPAIKENFGCRVIYSDLNNSDINVESLVVNKLRLFKSSSFRDYTNSYGNITKLVPWSENYLAIIFEHGLALVQINEKGVVSEIAKLSVYIDTTKVLGDLNMISEQYGSLWAESVILTPTGLYGIDASAKKIWRYYTLFESISDLKVGKFLKDNIKVSTISNLIDILNFNIKTHYNAKKQDIMFTFYKNLEYGNMIAWNLCYNEVTKKMTTFYSWIPLYSANIDNTYYSLPFIPEMSSKRLNAMLNPINNIYDPEDYILYIWEHNTKLNNWCNWYGLQHPFEFEYVINSNSNFLKIYLNLLLISNKAVPESFHFEIVGEGYDFSRDKKNMYYRLEATKSFYDWCLSRILADKSDFILYDKEGVNNYYLSDKLQQNPKSAIFPLTVKRLDFNNIIYDIYKQLTSYSLDYQSLSGSEIIYDPITNDYLINTHIKAHPKGDFIWQTVCRIDDDNVNKIATYYVNRGIEIRIEGEYLLKKVFYDQRLSNCYYNEDSWYILIPVINYYEKNENWSNFKNGDTTLNRPPLNIVTDPLPKELENLETIEFNPEYPIDTDNWVIKKLTPIRDKYVRVKIRYTGDDFVVISGIINTFKESYN